MQIREFFKPFFGTVFIIVILTFGQVIADLLLPDYMAKIVDDGIAKGNFPFIVRSGLIMLGIAFVGIICAISAGYFASRIALKVSCNMRESLFRHSLNFSLSEFEQIGTSSLITRTTQDVQQIQQTTFIVLRMMMRAPLMCVGGIIMAARKDDDLSMMYLISLPLMFGLVYFIMLKAIPLFRSVQRKIDQLNLVLRETLVGIRIIRAFSRIGFEKKKFASANDDLTETSIQANRMMAILNPAMNFCMNLLTIAIIYFASFRIDKGSLMVGDMMAFIQYTTQIFMSLMMISMLFVMLPRAFASAERIRAVFDLKEEITDSEDSVIDWKRKGIIRFKNVGNGVVQNISFSVNPGENVAIIGGTGAGKTTLLNLILRYYEVKKGQIEIDGIDIRKMKQSDLRDMIGLVPQKVTVFSGTINENIRMGKENASSDEIIEACKIAQADEFIENLPQKYDTKVAQGGTNISGGQKQRLSIARAVVKKPQIYLFDDSFSALDFQTEAKVREALKKETQNATVIIVAQRISSIINADKILVMDNGKIVGEGTHNELLKTNNIYREIAASQLSEEELM
ncbi:MAG: ABC transporter ATP-binding protein/permease [Dysgonamonadaceae bacterium]|jgi:ATP-binding cassette subfamily B protein|nr:ABC transporter ATP-binding protein/permease [Dysgonamonadaceae bacterium]